MGYFTTGATVFETLYSFYFKVGIDKFLACPDNGQNVFCYLFQTRFSPICYFKQTLLNFIDQCFVWWWCCKQAEFVCCNPSLTDYSFPWLSFAKFAISSKRLESKCQKQQELEVTQLKSYNNVICNGTNWSHSANHDFAWHHEIYKAIPSLFNFLL